MKRLLSVFGLFVLALSFVACQKGESNSSVGSSQSTASKASPTPPLTGFEKDLHDMRNGQYTYIWVFSRKDGKPLTGDDSGFLRKNAPQVVDWFLTDEGRKVIAGTNFNLEEGNMAELRKRLVAEDYSSR